MIVAVEGAIGWPGIAAKATREKDAQRFLSESVDHGAGDGGAAEGDAAGGIARFGDVDPFRGGGGVEDVEDRHAGDLPGLVFLDGGLIALIHRVADALHDAKGGLMGVELLLIIAHDLRLIDEGAGGDIAVWSRRGFGGEAGADQRPEEGQAVKEGGYHDPDFIGVRMDVQTRCNRPHLGHS
ncbi:MAG: hypothetical protein B7Z47_03900 [Chthoniobacter sp. 12-60-6]|nr:MAG: hypothetical protein B7Z47_03900 [Chthoniobacter sp. 12-60-6]